VDGYRLDYLVMCDTKLQTEDRVGSPIPVDSETTCAAQCSLINAQTDQDTCQAASFEAYSDGLPGGTCILSGANPLYLEKPGSVAVVHTGTYPNGNECSNLNAISNVTRSIDTSALFASVVSGGVAFSTPDLVTTSANGGVSQTYVSANSTDAQGAVHWSWFAVSASSSYWCGVQPLGNVHLR
jgi:hypothetical protein